MIGKDLECWRCGKEGAEFQKPAHPDGGGQICDDCCKRISGPTECNMCSGEYCAVHGVSECACDVIDRHDGEDCPNIDAQMVVCEACSRAGGADRAVRHLPPACPD